MVFLNIRMSDIQENIVGHMHSETGKIGKKGVFTIPASLRKRFGLHDGSLVIAEERDEGILLRPALAAPLEMYDDRRVAEFLLSNATDAADYEAACVEVRGMGLNPDTIPHRRPV
jgi:AbrB family looped-hinge helix DNA binding protein